VSRSEPDPLSQPTRTRLYELLRDKRRSAGTEELAAELGLHVNGVRRHLEVLQKAGLLERRRSVGRPGRPRDEWSIASDARPGGNPPEAYADLARWLARSLPNGEIELSEIERTGRQVGRELAPESGRGSLDERVGSAFAAMGFKPRVTTGPAGFSCKLNNCPYRDSVRENPAAVCRLHRGITEGLLDVLDPDAKLTRFEPRDPDKAGCLVEVVMPT
jgi:predicted ArsR family transcriptional regulator